MAKETKGSAKDFISAIHQLAHDKNIDHEIILEMLKDAMVKAASSFYKQDEEFEVEIKDETGEINIFAVKTAVKEVTNPKTEISIEEAKEYDEEVQEGDKVRIPKDRESMGRIAANAAKNVITQKVREFEKYNIYKEFEKRIGEVVNVTVRRFERGSVIVDMGKTEGIIRRENLLPRERYSAGDRIRAVIVDVTKSGDAQVVLSRTDPKLLLKLFEMEVPEIYDGTVKIKNIVREAGDRSKVSVYSTEPDVDPIGACVGVGGARIKSVLKELKGEKVDIIKYEEDIEKFAQNALSPAKLLKVAIVENTEESKKLEAIVTEDQYSLAIGTHGQNVRLASKLVGWTIDVRKEMDKKDEILKQMGDGFFDDDAGDFALNKLDVSKSVLNKLQEAGYEDIHQLEDKTAKDLMEISGIGEKTAEKIVESVHNILHGEVE